MLLGVDGVCIISHGSSSARAILNAVRVAHHAVTRGSGRAAAGAVAIRVGSDARAGRADQEPSDAGSDGGATAISIGGDSIRTIEETHVAR